MLGSNYEVLRQDDEGRRAPTRPTSSKTLWKTLISIVFMASVLLNLHNFLRPIALPFGGPSCIDKTDYGKTPVVAMPGCCSLTKPLAKLSYNDPTVWSYDTPWYNGNRSLEDEAWNKSPGYNVREAIVALPDSFTESVALPSAQRWPWDQSKGIYFIEGLHALHCVVRLSISFHRVT